MWIEGKLHSDVQIKMHQCSIGTVHVNLQCLKSPKIIYFRLNIRSLMERRL